MKPKMPLKELERVRRDTETLLRSGASLTTRAFQSIDARLRWLEDELLQLLERRHPKRCRACRNLGVSDVLRTLGEIEEPR